MDPASSSQRLMTVDEFERLPDDGWRSELVRGRVVREPPAGFRHGTIASRVYGPLLRFVEEHGLGEVVSAETGFVLFEDPPTVRAPDIAFVSHARLPADGPPTGFGPFAPDLTVEIVSPSNTLSEVQGKVLDYLEAGSTAVWVIDPPSRTVTVYHAPGDIRLLRVDDVIDGGEALPGFSLEVARIFE